MAKDQTNNLTVQIENPQNKLAFSIQTVHEALHHIDFVLNREVNEVGIDNDVKWRTQLAVVSQEQR